MNPTTETLFHPVSTLVGVIATLLPVASLRTTSLVAYFVVIQFNHDLQS